LTGIRGKFFEDESYSVNADELLEFENNFHTKKNI